MSPRRTLSHEEDAQAEYRAARRRFRTDFATHCLLLGVNLTIATICVHEQIVLGVVCASVGAAASVYNLVWLYPRRERHLEQWKQALDRLSRIRRKLLAAYTGQPPVTSEDSHTGKLQ